MWLPSPAPSQVQGIFFEFIQSLDHFRPTPFHILFFLSRPLPDESVFVCLSLISVPADFRVCVCALVLLTPVSWFNVSVTASHSRSSPSLWFSLLLSFPQTYKTVWWKFANSIRKGAVFDITCQLFLAGNRPVIAQPVSYWSGSWLSFS